MKPPINDAVGLKAWSILMVSIALTAVGQVLMKLSALQLSDWMALIENFQQWQLTSEEAYGLWLFAAGIACYFASMLLWMYILSFIKLSKAYPLLSLAYIVVYLAAVFLPQLQEEISLEKSIGILVIMIGVGIVSLPSKVRLSRKHSH